MRGTPFLVLVMLLATSFPPAVGAATSQEEWTVLYYMCGESTLEGVLVEDLNELESIGSNDHVDIVVQLDRTDDDSDGHARRYLVQKDQDIDVISSPPIMDLGEVDMTDPSTLKGFIEWGASEYPSEHYMLVLGGHGKGPATGLGTDGPKVMTTRQFGEAVRSVPINFDVVSLDMCWMGTAEIAAELAGSADYLIGSMDETPATGWPYDRCLPLITDGGGPIASRLGNVVAAFMDSYDIDGTEQYATLSVVDLDAFQSSFLPAWSDMSNSMFYSAFDHLSVYRGLVGSVDAPRSTVPRLVDAYGLASALEGSSEAPEIVRERAGYVLGTQVQVLPFHSSGTYHKEGSSAFGIYYPGDGYDSGYAKVLLSERSAWDDLLQRLESGLDARPSRLNWTTATTQLEFVLRSSQSARIQGVTVEEGDGSTFANHTCWVSPGKYTFRLDRAGRQSLLYRYKVLTTDFESIEFPPDGYAEVRFQGESKAPSLLHWPPALIDPSRDPVTAYVSDETGVDLGKSSLSYRVKGASKYLSAPMNALEYDHFTGIVTTASNVGSVEGGSAIEYFFTAVDAYGNSARYPASGNYETAVGSGKAFYVDMRHSAGTGYDVLLSSLNASFIIGDAGTSPLSKSLLSEYDGYILLEPTSAFTADEVLSLLSFHSEGGEVLLVVDPGSDVQMTVSQGLLEAMHLGPGKAFGGGILSSDPNTVLGGSLPMISIPAGGTFAAGDGAKSIYVAPGAGTVLSTSVRGKGRAFATVPDILSDGPMDRSANRALLAKVLSALSSNAAPVLKVVQDPPGVVRPGEKVVFDMSGSSDPDGEIVSYSMQVGGHYSESPDPRFEHVFEESGLYTLVFSVTDVDGAVSTSQMAVTANRPPSSEVGVSDLVIHAGELVIFSYKGSDPDGDQVSIEWDFADGSKSGSSTAYHTYKARGTYNVSMTVRDLNGLSSGWKGTVQVLNSDPVAYIDRDLVLINEREPSWTGPQKVTLKAFEGDVIFLSAEGSSDADAGDVLNFTWTIGGDTLYGDIAIFTLKDQGLLTILLEVEDGVGGRDGTNLTVYVLNDPPEASFTVKGDGATMEFLGQAVDDPWDMDGIEYRWDFGDGKGTSTSDPVVSHRYVFGGRYTVNLTVVDPDGGMGYFETEVVSSGLTIAQSLILASIALLGIAGIATWAYLHLRARMVREDRGLVEIVVKGRNEHVERPRYRSFSGMEGRPVRRVRRP